LPSNYNCEAKFIQFQTNLSVVLRAFCASVVIRPDQLATELRFIIEIDIQRSKHQVPQSKTGDCRLPTPDFASSNPDLS